MCPRCGGHLFPERDHYGAFVTCLQCGYVRERLVGESMLTLDETDLKGETYRRLRRRRRRPSSNRVRL